MSPNIAASSRRANVRFILGLVSILILACLQTTPTPTAPNPPVEIEYFGRVLDASSLQPIANAKITLTLEGAPPIVYTDGEGVFRFTVLIQSTRSGQIRVDAPGYEIYTRTITISTELKIIEDIRLTPQTGTPVTEIPPTDSSPSTGGEGVPATEPSSSPVTSTARPTNTRIPPTHSPLPTNPPSPTSPPSQTPRVTVSGCVELLDQTWVLQGSGPQEDGANTVGMALQGRNYIRIRYDLHGFFALPGDASAIIFDQPDGQVWHYISLSDYGQNGHNGVQTVDIPISAFPGLNINQSVGWLHTRFWSDNVEYRVEIFSIQACT